MLRRLANLAPAVTLCACVASNSADAPMIVLDNTAPAMGATTCSFTGDPAQPFISQGTINSLSPNPYLLTPLIQSRITAMTGQESTKTISLQGADVTLKIANGAGPALPETSFQSLFSGFVTPQGFTNVTLNLIPVDDLMAINSSFGSASGSVEVVATVVVKGLLGGDTVKALPFQYAVNVCNNCVLEGTTNPCPLTGTVRAGDPCNPFQDGIVDCCVQSGTLYCPGHQ